MEVSFEGNQDYIVGDTELVKLEKTVVEKSSNVDINKRLKLEKLSFGEEDLAWSLDDLRSAEIPVERGFEFTDDEPNFCHLRRLSPNHNQVVESEAEKLLEA